MSTLILGHRGAMGERPENTAVSFEKALKDGADGIEFDVHMTSDGIPVVIHDETVDRTTNGSGLIAKMTYDEIKKLRAGINQSDYTNQKILTLEETLDLSVEKSKLINIELKQGMVIYPGLEEKVLSIIKEYDIVNKVIISSFNHYSLKLIKKINKNIKCGLLYIAGIYKPWNYAKIVGVEAIHPFYASINKEIASECQKNDIMVNVYGANDQKTISHMLNIGVDAIITDYTGLAVELRNNYKYND
ncbi:MAG: glycerophosphodiester phosphodiesterase [Halanaerobiaceae bacterium]